MELKKQAYSKDSLKVLNKLVERFPPSWQLCSTVEELSRLKGQHEVIEALAEILRETGDE